MKRFTVRGTNVAFTCAHCGASVQPLTNGSIRNHCPACLHSRHVDEDPGDRASGCGGLLVPESVAWSGRKGWVVLHRCASCGAERRNRAAADDPRQPDDFDVLIALSRPDAVG